MAAALWTPRCQRFLRLILFAHGGPKLYTRSPHWAPETSDSCQTFPTSSERMTQFPTRFMLLKRKYQMFGRRL